MLVRLYWTSRLLAYLLSLAGILLHLYARADADPARANTGLALVGVGFLFFFVSYALRLWLATVRRRSRTPSA